MASIGEMCNREVTVAPPETTVADTGKLMRRYRVGCIIVVDGAAQHPARKFLV